MIRGLILALALFVAGCQSVKIDHRYENPKPYDSRLRQLNKDSVIQISTTDNKNITMKYKTVDEYAVTGYVDGVIDSIPLKNIDVVTFASTTYKYDEVEAGEVAKGAGAAAGALVVCLITILVVCPHELR